MSTDYDWYDFMDMALIVLMKVPESAHGLASPERYLQHVLRETKRDLREAADTWAF